MTIGSVLRVGVTLLATAAAVFVGWRLWLYYTVSPWTRDARVLAQVVEIAPRRVGPGRRGQCPRQPVRP
ncbi:hypothetical protein ACFSKM_23230 [Ancylobacter dichloromethanicus]